MPDEAPSISPYAAAALSVVYTLVYVLPFYLSSKTRPSPQLSRDAPSVIRARIRAVCASCLVASVVTIAVTTRNAELSLGQAMRLLGWWPLSLWDVAKSLALVAILFAGPLFEAGICEGSWRVWVSGSGLRESLGSWLGWRNYVAAPVTEEILFRSTMIPLHLSAGLSPKQLVFLTPLYFGVAHVHHFYEFRLTHPETSMLVAVLRTVIQFSYTSLFGFYAAFLFLRTGNLPAVILTHSFCNWMGLPRFWGRVEAPVAIGPQDVRRRELVAGHSPHVQVVDGQLDIAWTVAYYVLLASGAYGFYHCLWDLTASPNALIRFGKT